MSVYLLVCADIQEWIAKPENREMKNMKIISFFPSKTSIVRPVLTFFVVTYRVTNFFPKLVNMLLFSTRKKTEFPFLEFAYFRVLREWIRYFGQGGPGLKIRVLIQGPDSSFSPWVVTQSCRQNSMKFQVFHGQSKSFAPVQFLRAQGCQSGVSVWQHTLVGTRQSIWCECVATYSGRLVVARSFIRQHSSAKLLS